MTTLFLGSVCDADLGGVRGVGSTGQKYPFEGRIPSGLSLGPEDRLKSERTSGGACFTIAGSEPSLLEACEREDPEAVGSAAPRVPQPPVAVRAPPLPQLCTSVPLFLRDRDESGDFRSVCDSTGAGALRRCAGGGSNAQGVTSQLICCFRSPSWRPGTGGDCCMATLLLEGTEAETPIANV